jgi:hypothetical protein
MNRETAKPFTALAERPRFENLHEAIFEHPSSPFITLFG